MSASPTIWRRVVWFRSLPSWEEARKPTVPVYSATAIRVRASWRPALAAAVRHPLLVARALARMRPREVAALLAFLETASSFRIEALDRPDGSPLLTLGHRRPPRSSPTPASDGRIGAVVIAQNEEEHLPHALASLEDLVSELIVVDGGSDDGTADVARSFGATVIARPFDLDFAAQKNAGLAQLTRPWALAIDADETLDAELRDLLAGVVERASRADAVFIPRLNTIEGRDGDHLQWPDVQLRLFQSQLRFRGRVHEQVVGWQTAVFLPLSGPYLRHHKTLREVYRSSLLYSEIDPAGYPESVVQQIRAELERLEGGRGERPS